MSSAAVIPPGGTWFDTMKKSFADVPIDTANDNGIATTEFLEAAESLTTLFGMLLFIWSHWIFQSLTLDDCVDVLGSKAFLPVKSDLLGNIKVRTFSLFHHSQQSTAIDSDNHSRSSTTDNLLLRLSLRPFSN